MKLMTVVDETIKELDSITKQARRRKDFAGAIRAIDCKLKHIEEMRKLNPWDANLCRAEDIDALIAATIEADKKNGHTDEHGRTCSEEGAPTCSLSVSSITAFKTKECDQKPSQNAH